MSNRPMAAKQWQHENILKMMKLIPEADVSPKLQTIRVIRHDLMGLQF